MGGIDPASEAIGELKGMMRGIRDKIDTIERKSDRNFEQLEVKIIELHKEGCARGKSNSHRIDDLEHAHNSRESRDWGKFSIAASGIATLIVGIWRGIESILK